MKPKVSEMVLSVSILAVTDTMKRHDLKRLKVINLADLRVEPEPGSCGWVDIILGKSIQVTNYASVS